MPVKHKNCGEEQMAHDQDTLTRRRFVQATAAGSMALAGFGRAGLAQTAKLNIVFIMADDLGYADAPPSAEIDSPVAPMSIRQGRWKMSSAGEGTNRMIYASTQN